MSNRVLVTGGGGFLGRAVIQRLLARGMRVRSLARGAYPELAELGVETIRGDLRDPAAVQDACGGCGAVFHIAAKAGVWGRFRDYFDANVMGTRNVLAGCRAHGVGRLVHTSSPSVVFDGRGVEGADESLPYPRRFESHYSATKALAEQEVLTASAANLRAVALRPHLIWGPRDNHLLPRLVSRARAGRLRRIGNGRNVVDTTYIDNAADAHLAALDALDANPRAAGRPYFISNGEPRRLWELIDQLLEACGAPPVKAAIPAGVAWCAGAILESLHWLLRRTDEPRMTRFVARQLATAHWFDISAARRELGYEPRVSLAEGLQRLRDWHRDQRPGNSHRVLMQSG